MDGADYGKAMAELWGSGSRTLLAAQQGVLRAMREGAADPAGAAVPGAEAAKAMQALTEMWSSALGVSSALAGTLPAGGAEEEGTPAATLRRMADPRAWLSAGDGVDEALQRLAEGPRLADAGEVERRLAKVSRAWLALRQRSAEHQAVVLEGWMRAGRDFARKLAEQGKDDAFATSPRRMLDLWVETANRALLDTQRSEPFLRGQAALLKASTDLRFAQRDIAEHYADSFGLPTRRELDDVHRSVTELRRELRALTRRARAEELLALVGIASPRERLGSYAHQFSGGMRQRAMIAIALASSPKLLLADEPTTALDVTIQDQILKLLLRLKDELDMSVVIVTHDLGVVAQTCDRVAVMYAGRIVETAPVAHLLQSPKHAYTLGLLRSLPGRGVRRHPLSPIPGAPPNLAELPPGCAFAPRCPYVSAACREGVPPLAEVAPGRHSACVHHDLLPRPEVAA